MKMRLTNRVADMLVPPFPESVVEACSRCGADVYVTPGGKVPEGHEESEFVPVCTRCLISDPEIRRSASPADVRQAIRMNAIIDRLAN
jgi:hypothetical protein